MTIFYWISFGLGCAGVHKPYKFLVDYANLSSNYLAHTVVLQLNSNHRNKRNAVDKRCEKVFNDANLT